VKDALRMSTSRILKGLIFAGVGLMAGAALVAGGLIAWLTITDPFGGGPHPSDAAMTRKCGRRST
jgi:hypothetical protein